MQFRYDRTLFGRGKYLNRFPSEKAMASARDKIRALTPRSYNCIPIGEIVGTAFGY